MATCKYCGNDKLKWVETNGGYRLFDENTGEQHLCRLKINREADKTGESREREITEDDLPF